MPSDWLLITATLIGMPSSAQVASSWLVIWKQPSPSIAQTVLSGRADLGAHRGRNGEPHGAEAAGVQPVAAASRNGGTARPTSGAGRRPRCRWRPGRRSCRSARSRTAGTASRPRVRRTPSGYFARTSLAAGDARRRTTGCGRRSRSRPASAAIRSAMTSLQSPTIGTSAARFLPISAGSMSAWITFASGANESSLPVTRSSNRAPRQMSRSDSLQRADRGDRAVHAGHAEVQLVRVGQRAAGHQRGDHGDAE